ncbi:MAG: neutral/alkaline non-lysosomal ceramidase N-terminal domain-containing protein [Chitinophagaceae bacterium]|nr:neutral/alkaline non-lysosomal ceramidase N-terminal domain-containing protein [Chitinophagaceae bacterium]
MVVTDRLYDNGRMAFCFLRLLAGCCLFLCFSSGAFAQRPVFRAGAAAVNITPNLGQGIVGNFGIPPPAAYVHDELHARCLALDDGTTRLIFVIVDNVGIDRLVFDEAKRLIYKETFIPREQVLLAANHTHSAVSAGGEGEKRRGWNERAELDAYQTFVARRISDGVRMAIHNLEPARIGWGVGRVPQHLFNRRWKMKSPVLNPFGEKDRVRMNPGRLNPDLQEPAGPTDPGVSFISVQSREGRPLALLANYSLHYVGGVPDNHISGDYFAVFADRIQELLKADRQDPPFVGIMSNGTSGDVNNINFAAPAEQHRPYEKMRIVANDVAQEVLRVYKTIQHKDWVKLSVAQSELPLQVRKPDKQMLARAEKILSRPDTVKPAHPLEATYAQRIIQIQEEWPDQVKIILQAFRIGELGIAAIPFEVFTETGLELKAKIPFKTSFTIELANGSYGYLPTPEQHQLGGYETWLGTNRVEKGATQKIVAELLKLFDTIK